MRVALALMVMMAACGTPYQPNGFRGGYSNNDLGGGRHTIDVQVNGYTSSGTALDYAYRRAGELCPDGYDVIDGSKANNSYVYATKDFVTAGNKPEVALVVQCKASAAPSLVEESAIASHESSGPAARRVIADPRPIYCTSMEADPSVGLCSLDESKCDDLKIALQTQMSAVFAACSVRAGAACFTATAVIDAKRLTICSPTVKDCETRLSAAKANPDLTVAASSCGVYRVGAETAVMQTRDGENP